MAIEDYLFPMQSLTSKAAMRPEMNAMPMFTGLSGLQGLGAAGAGMAAGGMAGQGSPMGQMAGMVDQYADIRDQRQLDMTPPSFASQTPGAPNQPGRIDQSSFGGQQQMGQQMNALDLLSQNIAKRFGGM